MLVLVPRTLEHSPYVIKMEPKNNMERSCNVLVWFSKK